MVKNRFNYLLNEILDKALSEEPLSKKEILYLMGLKHRDEINMLFNAARSLRYKYFSNNVYLYGFLYLSTWCRNNCSFCSYRVSNTLCARYRKTDREVIDAAIKMAESGVHLIDLTMGEDPYYYNAERNFENLFYMIKEIKFQTSLPVMASFGALPDKMLDRLCSAGADWYACYQETHNKELFHKLRLNQNYTDRLNKKYKAAKSGLLIEEGILSGVGESLTDIVDSIDEMKNMNAHQVRVMNFIPQPGTPMQYFPKPSIIRELVIIAVLRIILPQILIPASLDVYGIDGLKGKLEAGANVVTSLIPPNLDMVGVAQSTLGVNEGFRTVKGISLILNELGLSPAELCDYIAWVNNKKTELHKQIVIA